MVIITFNEEKNIARCIQSVKDIADEIVVLDSFSKDNTKSICESLGVKFYDMLSTAIFSKKTEQLLLLHIRIYYH